MPPIRPAAPLLAALLAAALPALGAEPSTGAAPTLAELGELGYRDVVEGQLLELHGGVWRAPATPDSPAAILRLLPEPLATGDLDGDGTPEAAVLLAANGSRPESYRLLAVVARRPGGLVNLRTIRLGDRVEVSALRFADGAFEVVFGRAGAAAGGGTVRRFVASSEGVREAVGFAALGDVYWEVVVWDGRALRIPPRPTMGISGERLLGSGSCHRYRVWVGQEGWRLRVGDLQVVPRNCPKVLANRDEIFFAQLAAAERLERVGERLELVSREGDREVRLLLAPVGRQ